jgi:hypothetical protein
MPELALSDLFAILTDWWEDEERLIGIEENQELEFKERTHDLGSDQGKLEFAKDISAMANGGGGMILYGVRTDRDPAIGRDVSVRVMPLLEGVVDIAQLESVARDWIYPPQRTLEVREWRNGTGQMLVSLRVPPMGEPDGLVIIRAAEVDERVKRNVFGVAMRHSDRIDLFNADEIYHWIRIGRRVALLPPGVVAGEPGGTGPAEEADAELQSLRDVFAGGDWPVYVLQAWPGTAARLRRIHDRDGLRGALEHQVPLRPQGGFNLGWRRQAEVYRHGGLSVTLGDREGLRAVPSGVITFFATGGPDLLGWGMDRHGEQPLVNPTALAELTYEFTRIIVDVASPLMQPQPQLLRFRVALLYANRPRPITLRAGYPTMFNFAEPAAFEGEELVEDLEMAVDARAPFVTGELLRDFYSVFGLGREAIPFLDQETGEFSVDQFLHLAGGAAQ